MAHTLNHKLEAAKALASLGRGSLNHIRLGSAHTVASLFHHPTLSVIMRHLYTTIAVLGTIHARARVYAFTLHAQARTYARRACVYAHLCVCSVCACDARVPCTLVMSVCGDESWRAHCAWNHRAMPNSRDTFVRGQWVWKQQATPQTKCSQCCAGRACRRKSRVRGSASLTTPAPSALLNFVDP